MSLAAVGVPPAAAAQGGLAAGAASAADVGLADALRAAASGLEAGAAGRPGILLDVPSIADDGAVVPVSVSSAVPGTVELLVFVDVNPQPLAFRFGVPEGTEAFVATRIRMLASGTVLAAVRTESGALHAVARPVQVTVGGCG